MSISQIFLLFAGISLFLFGMTLMGDGLKKASGSKLEPILYRLSGTPVRGVLLGTGVTAILQSSCATSVMAVGFVNSGMMKLRQAIGVILGSILGTSITGWIVCLSYGDGTSGLGSLLSAASITGIAAVAGVLLRLFSSVPARQHAGDIFLGFAILMLGMSTMSGAAETLGTQPWFMNMLTTLRNPLLGILAGALFTAVLQSASAAVGILQALSVTGAMTFEAAMPLLLGVTVGASLPVLLSALGAGTEGKRAALVYPAASVLGAAACAALWYGTDAVFSFPLSAKVMDPFSLAAANTILRAFLLLLLMPFIGRLEIAVSRLVPEKDAPKRDAMLSLEERFLDHPALALEQCRVAAGDMAELSRASLEKAAALLTGFSEDGLRQVQDLEERVDRYEDALGTYLVKFTGRVLTERQSARISGYLRVLTDLERISDHALNIAESAQEMHEKQLHLSDEGARELTALTDAAVELARLSTDAFTSENENAAQRVEALRRTVAEMCGGLRNHQIERLQHGKSTLMVGFILNDLATDIERAAEHCANLAEAAAEFSDRPQRPRERVVRLSDDPITQMPYPDPRSRSEI